MSKQLFVIGIALTLFLRCSSSQATLIDLGNGVIWNDSGTIEATDDNYWIQDLSLFTNQTYDAQIASISALNDPVSGLLDDAWGTWRMASLDDINSIWHHSYATLTDTFLPSETRATGEILWYGRVDSPSGTDGHEWTNMWYYPSYGEVKYDPSGYIADTVAGSHFGAWVVADAVSPVPEPATILLFGSGLAGIVGYRRKQKE